jgi:predicted tellurium resistance membrane protein TerC
METLSILAAEGGAGLFSVESLIALLTLTALEIVLGIDNIVFLSIIAGKAREDQQDSVRQIGLILAMGLRIVLLLGITWVMKLTTPLFAVLGAEITGKDLVLVGGGLFLIAKGTFEIHHLVEKSHPAKESEPARRRMSFAAALAQVAIMDLIFSLDSVITAVGMARRIEVMIAAVVIAILVMLLFAKPIGRFVETHLPIKNLALCFLVMVGILLVADGLHQHLPRGYVYFAMAFSLTVELLNLRAQAKRERAEAGENEVQ